MKISRDGSHTEIHHIFRIDLLLDPLFYIMGAVPEGSVDKHKLYLLHRLLLVARKMMNYVFN